VNPLSNPAVKGAAWFAAGGMAHPALGFLVISDLHQIRLSVQVYKKSTEYMVYAFLVRNPHF